MFTLSGEQKQTEWTKVPLMHYPNIKSRALLWADAFAISCFMDSNQYHQDKYHDYEWLIGADAVRHISLQCGSAFEQASSFFRQASHYCFGYFGYDLKNEIEQLTSQNDNEEDFDDGYFFEARYVLFEKEGFIHINRRYAEAVSLLDAINQTEESCDFQKTSLHFTEKAGKESYLSSIEKIKNEIIEGNVYELNFCRNRECKNAQIHPLKTYIRLNELTKSPFSAYFKMDDKYLLSFSPERFLKKKGRKIISQPMKGTIRRGINKHEDNQLIEQLRKSLKDRAENVMIVDLVRNDLTHFAKTGSIRVEELFGIYSFETVHQMVSTVSAELADETIGLQALKKAFPMGSMTGAPKISAMQLIDNFEDFKRGAFSGALGFVSPDGNFDFSVLIRTLIYNKKKAYLAVRSGGAITIDSNAHDEYEESNIKINTLLNNFYL